MPVSVQTPYIEYTADGSTTHFPLTFDCFNQDHLIVKLNDAEAEVGAWSLNENNIIFLIAPVANTTISIERNTPLERTRNYRTTDNSFRPTPINNDFDDIWRKLQELGFKDFRCLEKLLEEVKQRIESDQNLQRNIDEIDKNLHIDISKIAENLAKEIVDRTNNDDITLNKSKEFATWYVDTVLNKLVKGVDLSGVTDGLVVLPSGRTQREKNAESVSLADFGAVGDGIADDTQAVWKAWNSGQRIFNGLGRCLVTDPELIRLLKYTSGTDKLIYEGNTFPCGDIDGFGVAMHIPHVFYNISHAFEWLSSKRILKNGEAFIKVADGVYQYSWTTNINHIDGDKIKIIGNEEDCTKCRIELDNSDNHDGFFISDGHAINFINGFHILGTYGWISRGEWNLECYGAGGRAINGGVLRFGPKMWVEKMYYGLRAMYDAKIEADYMPPLGTFGGGFKVTQAGDVGIHAYASSVQANGATVTDAAHMVEGLGFGFCAEAGGFVICEYALAMYNLKAGFYAISNGVMWAHSTESLKNMYGVFAGAGHIECNSFGRKWDSRHHNNDVAGVYVATKGFVGANGAMTFSNKHGFLIESGAVADVTATISTYNEHGYTLESAGNMHGGAIQCQYNTKNGISANNNSTVRVENIQYGNNGGYDIEARNGAIVYSLDMPDSAIINLPIGQLSARNSAIYKNFDDYLPQVEGDQSKADVNGYQKIGDSLLQWGTVPDAGSGERDYYVYFPKPFPNNCFNVTANRIMKQHGQEGDGGINVVGLDKWGVRFSLQTFSEDYTSLLTGFCYQAIGN